MEIRWGHLCQTATFSPATESYDIHQIFRNFLAKEAKVDRPAPGTLFRLDERYLIMMLHAHNNEPVENELYVQFCDVTGAELFAGTLALKWGTIAPGFPKLASKSFPVEAVARGVGTHSFRFSVPGQFLGCLPYFVTSASTATLPADPDDPIALRVDWAHLCRQRVLHQRGGEITLLGVKELSRLEPGTDQVHIDSGYLAFQLSGGPATGMSHATTVTLVDQDKAKLFEWSGLLPSSGPGVDGRIYTQGYLPLKDILLPVGTYEFEIRVDGLPAPLKSVEYWVLPPGSG